jgi:hypothetical protein
MHRLPAWGSCCAPPEAKMVSKFTKIVLNVQYLNIEWSQFVDYQLHLNYFLNLDAKVDAYVLLGSWFMLR